MDPRLFALAAKMKADWDHRARENARFYIVSDDWKSEEAFWASGVRDAALILRGLEGFLHPRMRVLEIGCGIGRLLRALAPRFAELHGVDVSGEMIRQGTALLADCPNVALHETNGVNLTLFKEGRFDFVFSYITFQHMPTPAVVACCREVRRVLASHGLFRFQVFDAQRTDGQRWDPPADDTFTLRSLSEAQLAGILDEARLEPVARYEIHAPERYLPEYRTIRQIWLTCRPRIGRRLWWRHTRLPRPETAQLGAGSLQPDQEEAYWAALKRATSPGHGSSSALLGSMR